MIHKLQVAVDERYLSLYLTVMNCDNVLCVDFCLFSVIKVCKCDIICPEPETTICTHYRDCSKHCVSQHGGPGPGECLPPAAGDTQRSHAGQMGRRGMAPGHQARQANVFLLLLHCLVAGFGESGEVKIQRK